MPKRSSGPLVYVDSDVYIDLITRNTDPHKKTGDPRWISAKAVFDAVNSREIELAASALTEAEVCCHGDSRKGTERVNQLLSGWFTAPSTAWTDIDRYLAREAAGLLTAHRDKAEPGKKMRTADALHLAAAIRLGAEYLMTHDGGFPHGHRIGGVQVLRPEVVWQQSLWSATGTSGP